jgi:hypothetical protein
VLRLYYIKLGIVDDLLKLDRNISKKMIKIRVSHFMFIKSVPSYLIDGLLFFNHMARIVY